MIFFSTCFMFAKMETNMKQLLFLSMIKQVFIYCTHRKLKLLSLVLIPLCAYVSWPLWEMIYKDEFGVTSRYKTYLEAVDDGAVQREWIPAFVPEDAHDIQERHIGSPPESFLKFKYTRGEGEGWISVPGAEAVSADDLKFIPSGVDKAMAKYYRLPDYDGTACLIDDQTHKTAYFSSYCLKGPSKP